MEYYAATALHVAVIGIVFTIVDVVLPRPSSQVLAICMDELCHGISALLLWNAVIVDALEVREVFTRPVVLLKGWMSHRNELLLAAGCACLIDVDHFLAANSMSMHDATHLHARPFGHAVLFILVFAGLTHMITGSRRYACLTASSLLCHQLRDAERRGLWLWPANWSTPSLPLGVVLFIYLLIPLGVRGLLLPANTASINPRSAVEQV